VQEVYDDPLWGKVVIINHGNDFLTKYANLSQDVSVQEGVKVAKGDVIGKIGKTAKIEMLMKPHLHFEVIENGISVNPSKYLSSF
ncbi:MAG: M23 family metallopeptidase, partial [Tissierellales bacterium]